MYKGKKIVAIIPARAGSRRVRRKNVRMMDGKPLYAHTVAQGRAAKYIDAIYLSTDDAEILRLDQSIGVEIIKRPRKYALAKTVMDEVLRHALTRIPAGYDIIVLLQPTSPLRRPETIEKAIRAFVNCYEKFDSLMPLRRATEKMGTIVDGRYVSIKMPSLTGKPPEKYIECGTVFVYKTGRIMAGKTSMGKRIYPFIVEDYAESIDVDLVEEFLIADYFKRNRDGE